MFLELNTIGCSHLVFVIARTTTCVGGGRRISRPGDCRPAGLASLPGYQGTDRRTGSSNSRKAMPRSKNRRSRTAPAFLRFRGTPRVLEDVVRRETMRDDQRQYWWAHSVDLAGRDGSVDSGVVVAGNLGSLRRVRGRIGGWIGDRIGGWIRGRIRGRFRGRAGGREGTTPRPHAQHQRGGHDGQTAQEPDQGGKGGAHEKERSGDDLQDGDCDEEVDPFQGTVPSAYLSRFIERLSRTRDRQRPLH